MKESLVKTVKDFFSFRVVKGSPLLLGFSGGVDSSALLSLVLECRRFFSLDIHVAHFDHAWREESLKEAEDLKIRVEGLGLVFHSVRSDGKGAIGSNREERAREERYAFFKKVYIEVGAQALVLAHQRDDQVETVLKRIFEGAGLLSSGGMQQDSLYKGMVLWRPLLSIAREELIEWNSSKGISCLMDSTNLDLQFLRPRMREKLLPEIEKWFGKNIRKNIFSLGEELSYLKTSIEKKLKPFLAKKIEGPLGVFLPIMDFAIEDSFERQELVRLFLAEKGVSIGRPALKNITALLEARLSDKKIDVETGCLIIDQGNVLWLFHEPAVFFGTEKVGEVNNIKREGWNWEVVRGDGTEISLHPLIYSFLQGELSYSVSSGTEIVLSSYELLKAKDQKKISGFFSKNKVPARIRKFFPFVIENKILLDLCFVFNLNSETNIEKENLTVKLKKN